MLMLVGFDNQAVNVEIQTNKVTVHVSAALDLCSSEKIWTEGIIVQNEKVGQQPY